MTVADGFPIRAPRTVVLLALAVVMLLLLGAGSAHAARSHAVSTSSFGPNGTEPNGTPGSEYCGLGALDIDQTNQHLFTFSNICETGPAEVQGFQLNSPTSRTPLGGKFPIETPYPNQYFLAAGNGPGNIYISPGSRGKITGYTDSGESAGIRYPLEFEETYICGLATDSEGDVWASFLEPAEIREFSPDGVELLRLKPKGGPYCAIDLDRKTNDLFLSNEYGPVRKYTVASEYTRSTVVMPDRATHIAVDAASGLVYAAIQNSEYEYLIKVTTETGAPVEEFALEQGHNINDLAVDEADDTVYVARENRVEVFPAGAIVANAITGPVASAGQKSATVTATVETEGGPAIETCNFEYGEEAGKLTQTIPCDQPAPLNGTVEVTATLPNLVPGRRYFYRIAVKTSSGTSKGAVRQATTAGPPTIEGLFSSHVTESTAELTALINPQGSSTTYHFEYGVTAEYGNEAPIGGADIGGSQDPQKESVNLASLGPGTYHFRVVATNAFGTTVSPDQTFNFNPPECPNAHIRQQTGGSYLPDCRGYELVSPGNANGVIMFPNSSRPAPYATNPPRFPFDAALGVIPGQEPTNALGVDTYIATRTDTGWVTHYSGVRGYESLGQEGPWGDLSWDKILDFRSDENFGGVPQPYDDMPYIWDSAGNFIERWPANRSSVPGSNENFGAYQPSPDFSHLAFTSINNAFTPNGKVEAPGSAYDYNVATHTTTLISLLPNGEPIPAGPASFSPYEFMIFPDETPFISPFGVNRPEFSRPKQMYPGVSTDGSHILMDVPEAGYNSGSEKLFMRVNDAVTYMVSKNHAVHYVGMTSNGAHVFFTSNERLLPAVDKDESVDLYEWNEASDSLSLISVGGGSVGNENECNANWTSGCNIEVVQRGEETDYPIATENGDIYFYSPELLAGPNEGVPGRRNLFLYRNGQIEYVTTMGPENSEAITRIQVSPDGLHMAFITSTRIGAYENLGYEEMYTFEPETKKLTCVSCLPNGETPTDNVQGSLAGLFMSNDGRTFFYTTDPLVPRDTDGIHDVYEYTEGQPQLISSGTAPADQTQHQGNSRPGGLEGVSANGQDVYFATYENLVPQDENGQFLKIYDARVNGGFPFTPPPTACEAADECHGEGSVEPTPAQVVSEDGIGKGGNYAHHAKHKKKKHKKHKKKKKSKADAGKHKKKSAHGAKGKGGR